MYQDKFYEVWMLKTKRHSTRQTTMETFFRVCLCTHYMSHISVNSTDCINHTIHTTPQRHIQKACVFYQQVSETIILQEAVIILSIQLMQVPYRKLYLECELKKL